MINPMSLLDQQQSATWSFSQFGHMQQSTLFERPKVAIFCVLESFDRQKPILRHALNVWQIYLQLDDFLR